MTSPAAAKAVEDTAFYRSAVLLSRNDVGFSTEQFSAPVADFHGACAQRLANFPDNLLATATHDHKRGEDTRARLAVLSERSKWYAEQVGLWRALARPLRDDDQMPSAGDELILYQAMLGSWPLELRLDDPTGLGGLRQTHSANGNAKPCVKPSCRAAGARRTRFTNKPPRALSQRLLLSPEGDLLRAPSARPPTPSPCPAPSTDWRKPCCA